MIYLIWLTALCSFLSGGVKRRSSEILIHLPSNCLLLEWIVHHRISLLWWWWHAHVALSERVLILSLETQVWSELILTTRKLAKVHGLSLCHSQKLTWNLWLSILVWSKTTIIILLLTHLSTNQSLNWKLGLLILVRVWHLLDLGSSPSNSLIFSDLQDTTSANAGLDVPLAPLTELFELLIDIEKKLFDLGARIHVLWIETGANAEMKRLFWLLLLWSFLKSWALTSQSQLNNLSTWWHILAALANDTLHVATFGPDESTGNLKFFLIGNLDVKSTSILSRAIVDCVVVNVTLEALGLLMLCLVVVEEVAIHCVICIGWYKWIRVLERGELGMDIVCLKFGPHSLEWSWILILIRVICLSIECQLLIYLIVKSILVCWYVVW